MKIYTKSGDDGTTGLVGNKRVWKNHLRIEAYGTIDELNAFVGQAILIIHDISNRNLLKRVQHELFDLGAELASEDPDKSKTKLITQDSIAALEKQIDRLDSNLEPLNTFILPGGTLAATALHVCRTVCRRAERLVVTLNNDTDGESPRPIILQYLNRLSDVFFVMARWENRQSDFEDVRWQSAEKRCGEACVGSA